MSWLIKMIRCDDIFIDSDVKQFEKICELIKNLNFEHLIGITPLGVGNKLWDMNFKIPFFINYRINKMCGNKYIGYNKILIDTLKTEFFVYKAKPAIHGLHHYRHDLMKTNKIHSELLQGLKLLKQLFDIRIDCFIPPFNAWNSNVENICKKLFLSIDKCKTSFDKIMDEMSEYQIIKLAKQQASIPEVYYHPYRVTDLNKFELYLKTRKSFC